MPGARRADPREGAPADVCLVVEGTYPYADGGVSAWAHDLVRGLPEVRFAVAHIGAERAAGARPRYELPPNVTALQEVYCRERLPWVGGEAALRRAAGAERRRHAEGRSPGRVLRALRRLHLDDRIDAELLDDLASNDLTIGGLLHGRRSFDLTVELCERLAPAASFLDCFWHLRSMHLPLVRLLGSPPPPASAYHAICTGYAGLLAAVWSRRTGRPFVLTEHAIYVRERDLELRRPPRDPDAVEERSLAALERACDAETAPALRRLWARFFRALARCAYAAASRIVSLSEGSRMRQLADGAPPDRAIVVPNGIDVDGFRARLGDGPPRRPERGRAVVAFVGRVVAIKDVLTFIRACHLAARSAPIDARIIGPTDAEPDYLERCRRLIADLAVGHLVRFEGRRPSEWIYREIDVLVLTSVSEGQPLVILEAGAAGIPVIATDVGACRELLEGRGDSDRRIGPSGIVTRLADAEETAAAIARLARDPDLRRRMGTRGRRRVATYYQQRTTVARYRALYGGQAWQASAGASSA